MNESQSGTGRAHNPRPFPALEVNREGFGTLSNLSREEAATIWFALGEYKKGVLKTVAENPDSVEDESFCYGVAAVCARLQFHMRDDHGWEGESVRKWLDV